MYKTICSSIVIFSAMSVPITSAQDSISSSPYIMEQTDGNEVYRPLFYTPQENTDNIEGTTDRTLEYNNLIFTENSEYPDVFVSEDRNIMTDLWSEYWTEIEKLTDIIPGLSKSMPVNE